jgi:hypothetical protein
VDMAISFIRETRWDLTIGTVSEIASRRSALKGPRESLGHIAQGDRMQASDRASTTRWVAPVEFDLLFPLRRAELDRNAWPAAPECSARLALVVEGDVGRGTLEVRCVGGLVPP